MFWILFGIGIVRIEKLDEEKKWEGFDRWISRWKVSFSWIVIVILGKIFLKYNVIIY